MGWSIVYNSSMLFMSGVLLNILQGMQVVDASWYMPNEKRDTLEEYKVRASAVQHVWLCLVDTKRLE